MRSQGFLVYGAGNEGANGFYYRESHIMEWIHHDDIRQEKYSISKNDESKRWEIISRHTPIDIVLYWAPIPRIEIMHDTFYESWLDDVNEVNKHLEQMTKPKKYIPILDESKPSVSGWRLTYFVDFNPIFEAEMPLPSVVKFEESDDFVEIRDCKPHWHSAMIRTKDAMKNVEYYQKCFNMKLLAKLKYSNKTEYYLYSENPRKKAKKYGSTSKDVSTFDGTCINITQEDDSKNVDKYENGNNPGYYGFAHFGFSARNRGDIIQKIKDDNYIISIPFNEGKLRSTCYSLNPDGYLNQIMGRMLGSFRFKRFWSDYESTLTDIHYSKTSIRITNIENSLKFYCDILGMELIRELPMPELQFSLYTVSSCDKKLKRPESRAGRDITNFTTTLFDPSIEMIWDHLNQSDHSERHLRHKIFNGNDNNKKGFGFLAFNVNNVNQCINALKKFGYKILQKPTKDEHLYYAFVADPDGYWIKIFQTT